jgi:DNA-binding LacI/PurR family transcriptional regulator
MSSNGTVKTPTINDVALAAGVSKATAAQVWRGTGRISPATRALVLEAAQRLNYNPNPHALRLANGRCRNLIGLYSLNLELGPGTSKIKQIQRRLTEHGYDVPIYSYGSYGGGEVVDELALMRSLCSQRPVAIVCVTFGVQDTVLAELEQFQAEGGHVVCYDAEKEVPFDNVVYTLDDSMYQATRHLLELGHRQVGFCLHGAQRAGEAHYAAFTRALHEFGLAPRPDWTFHGELYEEAGMRYAARFLALRDRPTAIHVVNDVAASAFINEVQRNGVRVPQDLSVIGLNDSAAARSAAVRLSTVSQPVEQIVQNVIELLEDRLSGRHIGAPRRVAVRGELRVRESTAPPSSLNYGRLNPAFAAAAG